MLHYDIIYFEWGDAFKRICIFFNKDTKNKGIMKVYLPTRYYKSFRYHDRCLLCAQNTFISLLKVIYIPLNKLFLNHVITGKSMLLLNLDCLFGFSFGIETCPLLHFLIFFFIKIYVFMYVCVRVLMCAIPRQCSPAGFLKSQNSSVTRPNMVVSSERSGARGNTTIRMCKFLYSPILSLLPF